MTLKLRKLRVLHAVWEAGSIAGAANSLNLSQPAVTRAIQSMEEQLGIELLNRHGRNATCGPPGELLALRVRRALDQLRIAEMAILSPSVDIPPPVLSAQASDHELLAVIHIASEGSVSGAARRVGLSQPALNRSLRVLEQRIGRDLFHRTGQGMRPTPAGEQVVRRTKLAFSEIRQGVEELAFQKGSTHGSIRIGALPLTRVRLVPFAVGALLERYPEADIAIEEGSYAPLIAALRNGDIDILVGTVREPPPFGDIRSIRYFDDEISIVVSHGHPLAAREDVKLADCLEWDWVLPFRDIPLRVLLEKELLEMGLPLPRHVIETDSMITARTLLITGTFVAAFSPHQIYYEQQIGLLKSLPIKVEQKLRPVGATMRGDFSPTPLASALLEELVHSANRVAGVRR